MNKYKNISLVKNKEENHMSFIVIKNDGGIDSYFTFFMNKLINNNFSKSTVEVYAIAVATFIDYIFEALIFENENNNIFDLNKLYDYTEMFPRYLSSSINTKDNKIHSIAKRLNFLNPVSHSTEVSYIAAINKYLIYSEEYNRKINEINDNESVVLFKRMRSKIDKNELLNIKKNSIFATLVAGGSKIKNNVILKPSKRGKATIIESKDEKEFPLSKVKMLINANKDYLTKTIISLLACSGLRLSEALLITFNDIDFVNRSIKIRNPKIRPLEDFNNYFTYEKQQELPFKSRTTENVFLIHPFDDDFWSYLQLYLTKERVLTDKHTFIFNVKNEEKPLIESEKNLKAITQKFKYKSKKVLGIDFSPHSLRHMYISYLVNYFPCQNGNYGLPIHKVQKIVGHTNLKSTEVYIHTNIELNKLQQMAFFQMQGISDLKIKKALLLSELNKIEKLINEQ